MLHTFQLSRIHLEVEIESWRFSSLLMYFVSKETDETKQVKQISLTLHAVKAGFVWLVRDICQRS